MLRTDASQAAALHFYAVPLSDSYRNRRAGGIRQTLAEQLSGESPHTPQRSEAVMREPLEGRTRTL